MTRDLFWRFAAAIIAGTWVAHVDAHHSIARFDGARVVEISGVVSGFRWINPHASIDIDSPGHDGMGRGKWVVEMQAPTTMMGAGWSRESLAEGDRVTVFANPLRDGNPAGVLRALYVGAILPDGRMLGRAAELRGKGAR